MIRINANKPVEQIHNFWNNIHFHPTDAIEDEWGKEILDAASKDKVAQRVRIYAMLEDIVTADSGGNLQYDFTDTDTRIDYMVEKGFKLLICMNFLPTAIATDKKCFSKTPRYKGKRLNTSAPVYELWQEVCAAYVQHLIDRYGKELVCTWYFHCWNEANHMGFWMSKEEDWNVRTDAYIKLYDYFAEGIKGVCKDIKIGGPSAGYNPGFYPYEPDYHGRADYAMLRKFFSHIKSGKNFANGGIGTPIDFYSIHVYGADPDYITLDPEDAYRIGAEHVAVAAEFGYDKLPLIGDEWEACGGGWHTIEEWPSLLYHNTERFPAHYFAMIKCFLDHHAPYEHLMICLSGQHNSTKEFSGSRTFVTKSGFRLPIYNGYALAAMLGNTRLSCENDTKIGVIPTAHDNGDITIALYNYSIYPLKPHGPQHIALNVEIPEGEYTVEHYRIDAEHCNSYSAWCKLGKPETMTQVERETIKKAQNIKTMYPNEIFSGNLFTDKIVMPDDAVSVIRLIKK